MASDDLVGLALRSILTLASILVPSLLVFFVFFKKPTPRDQRKNNKGKIRDLCPNFPMASSNDFDFRGTQPAPGDLPGHEFDVFLSFRGADTREGFTDYLYHGLKGAGISAFRDDEELRVGEEIGPELVRGIKQSKISIPIFSKDYASSKWCLKEVALMVECRNAGNQLILPIFYDVTPNEVRDQAGSYADAFKRHLNKCGREEVQQWSHALKEVGALKGWELSKTADGHQGSLITLVVAKVLRELKKAHLHEKNELVGVDDRVEDVMGLLEVEARDVRIIGLWGMGGIGKTSLSKFIYNKLVDDFERNCCLPDIREASQHHSGLQELQGQLIKDLLRHESPPKFASIGDGVKAIGCRCRSMKVLILLDDIDQAGQLEALAADVNLFGRGSRIIVTTRNRDALRGLQERFIYEVREMTTDHALQLFCNHAFRKDYPPDELSAMSRNIVETTRGLPLAVEVISSYLSGKNKSVWEATLERLKKRPHKEVQEKLRISYEALEYDEKQVFLDIACFFIGESKRNASHMWNDCEFYPDAAIDVLYTMSLIKIGKDDKFWMHDQIRDLGREIVRQENYNVPGRRSRLWCREEVVDVLESGEGTSSVEAIRLQRGINAKLRCQTFTNLSNLRFLWLEGVNLDGNFPHLSSKLRWISWRLSSFACTTADLHLPSLFILDLSGSEVRDEWNFGRPNQIYGKLKILNLTQCRELTTTPDLSMFPNLESLILYGCKKLSVVHASIIYLKSLNFLSLEHCSRITKLPHQLDSLKALIVLRLNGTGIEELPTLEKLSNLEELRIDFTKVRSFPSTLEKLRKLRVFTAGRCEHLQGEIPIKLGKEAVLFKLDLSRTKICRIPEDISMAPHLEYLSLDGCKLIRSLPDLPVCLVHLEVSCNIPNLGDLINLRELKFSDSVDVIESQHLEKLSELETLEFEHANILSLPDELGYLPRLKKLELRDCKKLKDLLALPSSLCRLIVHGCDELSSIQGLGDLESLSLLEIFSCKKLKRLPDLDSLHNLTSLTLHNCESIEFDGIDELEALETLRISRCRATEKLNLSKLKSLRDVSLSGFEELRELGLGECEALEILRISECEAMEKLPNLSQLKQLKLLSIKKCKDLQEFEGLEELEGLERLTIGDCELIEELPDLSQLKELWWLSVVGCKKLTRIRGFENLKFDMNPIIRIRGCPELEASLRRNGFWKEEWGLDPWL